MKTSHIKYIERRMPNRLGVARIGLIDQLGDGKLYYKGRNFELFENKYLNTNYRCCETGEYYRIANCHPQGKDRSNGRGVAVIIDEDVRKEYWENIRKQPAKNSEMLNSA